MTLSDAKRAFRLIRAIEQQKKTGNCALRAFAGAYDLIEELRVAAMRKCSRSAIDWKAVDAREEMFRQTRKYNRFHRIARALDLH